MSDLCPCCELEPPMDGAETLGRKCFMVWYDSGITATDHLRAEVKHRHARGYWPWGSGLMPTSEIEAIGREFQK